jgi:hypothetical protein
VRARLRPRRLIFLERWIASVPWIEIFAVTDGARREPRDPYDLWYISNEGHIPHCEDLIDGLNRKLTSREGRSDDVLVSRLEQVEKTLKQRWDLRLRAQVMSLPEFDGCYRDVKRLLSDFDKLRGK